MTAFKILKWLTIILVTPWLVFMLLSVFKGGEPFVKMGDGLSGWVLDSAKNLAGKADTIKWQADEWKERYLGIKREEKEPEVPLKPAEKKPEKKKTKKRPPPEKKEPDTP
jgi:hypothetical protein